MTYEVTNFVGSTGMHFSNMVEINPILSDLCYFTHNLCGRARIVSINEYYDDLCSTKISSYSRSAPAAYMPSSNLFGKKDAINIEKILYNLKSTKIIVIHNVLDIDFTIKICKLYNPDLIISQDPKIIEIIKLHFLSELKEFNDIEILPARFSQLNMHLLGNEVGLTSLLLACNCIDGAYRINSKISVLNFSFATLFPKIGYYNNEYSGIHEWAWSGPNKSSLFCVPSISNVNYKITLFFFGSKIKLTSENLKLLVDEKVLNSRYFPDDQKIEIWYNNIGNRFFIPIEIRHQRVSIDDHEPRNIAFAIHKVRVEEVI